jgi:DNA-directed RNA polymerase II subunit RPB1
MSQSVRVMQSLLPTRGMTKVRFSISGDADNELDSYAAIDSYDMFKNNVPYPGGIYDPKLGTTDYTYKCDTCRNDKESCIGHEGHHRLNYPVKQPIFESDIIKWLNVICFKCGKCILSDEKVKSYGEQPLREIYNFAKTASRKCYWCSNIKGGMKIDSVDREALQLIMGDYKKVEEVKQERVKLSEEPIIIGAYEINWMKKGAANEELKLIIENLHPQVKRDKNNPYVYKAMYTDKENLLYEETLYPHKIAEIFSRISDETVRLLGRDPLSHPNKLILNVIKIPPSAIRPDTRRFGGMRIGKNNELSTPIQYILKKNSKIPIGFNETDVKYLSSIEKTNEHYYDFVKGTSAGKASATSSQPNKSLANSMVGKQGNIRKTHLGKRVAKMCRSTINCNPTLKINEILIPITVAINIQMEEVFQPYNKDRLMVYFNNGRKKYPGCTMIKKKNIKEPFSIENIREDFIFEYGDTIYRDIITGDYLLFNRQPSLHFSSIGCHRIVVNLDSKASTLEFNVIGCPWYNADFNCQDPTVGVLLG